MAFPYSGKVDSRIPIFQISWMFLFYLKKNGSFSILGFFFSFELMVDSRRKYRKLKHERICAAMQKNLPATMKKKESLFQASLALPYTNRKWFRELRTFHRNSTICFNKLKKSIDLSMFQAENTRNCIMCTVRAKALMNCSRLWAKTQVSWCSILVLTS